MENLMHKIIFLKNINSDIVNLDFISVCYKSIQLQIRCLLLASVTDKLLFYFKAINI